MYALIKKASLREKHKQEITNFWKKFNKFYHEGNATTLFIFGTYNSLVNNNLTEGQKLMDQYFEIQKK